MSTPNSSTPGPAARDAGNNVVETRVIHRTSSGERELSSRDMLASKLPEETVVVAPSHRPGATMPNESPEKAR